MFLVTSIITKYFEVYFLCVFFRVYLYFVLSGKITMGMCTFSPLLLTYRWLPINFFFECCENINFFWIVWKCQFFISFFYRISGEESFLNNKAALRRTRNRLVHIINTNKFQKSENYHYYQIIIIIIKLSVIITWSAW